MHTDAPPRLVSPLQLADRLVHLAMEAGEAGFSASAQILVGLASSVLDVDESGLGGERMPPRIRDATPASVTVPRARARAGRHRGL